MSALYLVQSKEIAARMMGGEMIIMSPRDSTLFSLNKVGTAIWQAADGETPLDEIVEQKVCARFEIDPAGAYRDAESFARELAEHELLILSDQPISSNHETARPADLKERP
jgi:hypothetical protein